MDFTANGQTMNLAMVGFDIAVIIFCCVLLPKLNKLLDNQIKQSEKMTEFTENVGNLCLGVKDIAAEIAHSRVRDAKMEKELENIKSELSRHADEERRKNMS